jgi:hypothetical protein
VSEFYLLKDRVPVKCSLEEWATWERDLGRGEANQRRVAQDDIGDYKVSTVFLGLDHQLSPEGPPEIFETMVFHKATAFEELAQTRCATWEEAEFQHEYHCALVRELAGVPLE